MEQPTRQPTELEKFLGKMPLYVRIGFALVVVFGMVGNCARPGDTRPVVLFVMTALVWTLMRILQEGIEAYRILKMANAHDAELKAGKKPDDKAPPSPPAST